jgi:hypothetical protein
LNFKANLNSNLWEKIEKTEKGGNIPTVGPKLAHLGPTTPLLPFVACTLAPTHACGRRVDPTAQPHLAPAQHCPLSPSSLADNPDPPLQLLPAPRDSWELDARAARPWTVGHVGPTGQTAQQNPFPSWRLTSRPHRSGPASTPRTDPHPAARIRGLRCAQPHLPLQGPQPAELPSRLRCTSRGINLGPFPHQPPSTERREPSPS